MKTLAHLTSSFDFDNMRQISLIEPYMLMTTGTINDISYVLPSAGVGNYGDIQNYVAEQFSSDPRMYESSTILVLNATSTAGLATTEKENLEAAGYREVTADNAPTGDYDNSYTLYAINETAPGTKQLLEEKYNTTAKNASDLPEGIPVNYTFVIILGEEQD